MEAASRESCTNFFSEFILPNVLIWILYLLVFVLHFIVNCYLIFIFTFILFSVMFHPYLILIRNGNSCDIDHFQLWFFSIVLLLHFLSQTCIFLSQKCIFWGKTVLLVHFWPKNCTFCTFFLRFFPRKIKIGRAVFIFREKNREKMYF